MQTIESAYKYNASLNQASIVLQKN